MAGTIPERDVLKWAESKWKVSKYNAFATGLSRAIRNPAWGWHFALGHNYRNPDYGYQHPKAMELLLSCADFLSDLGLGGIVLMLDEVENIDKQSDIRGRRKSYDTLAQFASHRGILPVLFVTDRLFRLIEADQERGESDGWWGWDAKTESFMKGFLEREVLRPPKLNDQMALTLVNKIAAIYAASHGPILSTVSPEAIVSHWQRAPIRSVRLLVRLTVNEVDLAMQNTPPELLVKASQGLSMQYGQSPTTAQSLPSHSAVPAPWQMTRGQYQAHCKTQGRTNVSENNRAYLREVEAAIQSDKPVPANVLAEYNFIKRST
jgi:hypothetical protein